MLILYIIKKFLSQFTMVLKDCVPIFQRCGCTECHDANKMDLQLCNCHECSDGRRVNNEFQRCQCVECVGNKAVEVQFNTCQCIGCVGTSLFSPCECSECTMGKELSSDDSIVGVGLIEGPAAAAELAVCSCPRCVIGAPTSRPLPAIEEKGGFRVKKGDAYDSGGAEDEAVDPVAIPRLT